jgi:hypothetical protein
MNLTQAAEHVHRCYRRYVEARVEQIGTTADLNRKGRYENRAEVDADVICAEERLRAAVRLEERLSEELMQEVSQ